MGINLGDLNPVACLILKVMLEDIPRHGPALADELRRAGRQIKEAAEKELAEFYPPDPDGAIPIAYLWARTVRCETPNCGAEIPLVRSFWLCNKANRRRALRYKVVHEHGVGPRVEFEIFEPATDRDVPPGTVSRAKATCPCCSLTLPPQRVRAQLVDQHGGADVVFDQEANRIGGARMLAVVSTTPGEQGRRYRLPGIADYYAVWHAQQRLARVIAHKLASGLSTIPDEPIPRTELRRVSLPIYGVSRFCDMFTARQMVALSRLVQHINQVKPEASGAKRLLALCLGKTADLNNANTRWKPDAECPVNTLARHNIPVAWDFSEAFPLGDASGSFGSAYERTAVSIAPTHVGSTQTGTVQSEDACSHPLPTDCALIWFTDPPYYDSVPYAHLSDLFYVWEGRALQTGTSEPSPLLAPKRNECVVDRPHSAMPDAKTAQLYEQRIQIAMSEGARVTRTDGIACVVFAHKTTEGWEALLSGMIGGGWVIAGSWPIVTEMQSRLNARDNASLAASVHLVCRPRPDDVRIGDWTQVLRELPRRVGDWMERLQGEGVRGADLVFACIGPALEIFSRYSKVETPEGREVNLPEFLEKVWEVVGRAALEQVLGTEEARARNSAAGVLEEDVRLTALFLWTLQATDHAAADDEGPENDEEPEEDDQEHQNGKKKPGFSLIYDVVRRFAQPLGIHLEDWEGRIIETKKGVVRLLPVRERARQLFGDAGADVAADRIERAPTGATQLDHVFDELAAVPEIRLHPRRARAALADEALRTRREATTLDRVHAAMLLQASGRSNALRALLKAETERSPDFLRLANALSALYPQGTEEKRLVEAMVQAAPR